MSFLRSNISHVLSKMAALSLETVLSEGQEDSKRVPQEPNTDVFASFHNIFSPRLEFKQMSWTT
jgi:hypothetical protein